MKHPGEIAVRERTGVYAENLGSAGVGSTMPPVVEQFLARQPFVVVTAERDRAIWTTVLSGEPGFVEALDEATLLIDADLHDVDPLSGAFDDATEIGLIAIEPATRRRVRINGRSHRHHGGLVVHAHQVYGNCPKYIQTRSVEPRTSTMPPEATRGTSLDAAQQEWVRRADTFFIGTSAPGHGMDASHRGGNPGFVSVVGDTITWPDYVGNSMYMTLGNLELDPRAGLLFLDWEGGHTLHVTGRARVDWDPARAARHPGAQRLVDLAVEQVVQVGNALPLSWRLQERSRHNPTLER